MMRITPHNALRAAAAIRMAYGVATIAAAPAILRRMVPRESPSGSYTLFVRTVGIRNFAFGLGCLLATRNGSGADVRRWAGAWLVSDAADIAAGISARSSVGTRGAAIAAAAPLPFAATGMWFLLRGGATRETR